PHRPTGAVPPTRPAGSRGHPLGPSVVEAHPPAARGARTLGRESPRRRSSRPPRSSPALVVPSPTVCASAPGGRPGEPLWRPGAGPPHRLSVERRARRLDMLDRKSTRLNSSHVKISYAVFCLKKKNTTIYRLT